MRVFLVATAAVLVLGLVSPEALETIRLPLAFCGASALTFALVDDCWPGWEALR